MAINSLISSVMRRRRSTLGRCVACGRPVAHDASHLVVRGMFVHRECATYRMRQIAPPVQPHA